MKRFTSRLGTWDEAFEAAATSFVALGAEEVRLAEAAFRVAAQDVRALCTLPAYATSAVDGWVVAGEGPWRIVGEVATGVEPLDALPAGTCMWISTGGVITANGDSVIPWEDATAVDQYIHGRTSPNNNVRPAAAECAAGDAILTAGTSINPVRVGLLAATGHDRVSVVRRPRVALFVLGDELLDEGVPTGGAIRDSLGVQLPAFLRACGADVIITRFLKDDLPSVLAAADEVMPLADVLITTGGTADGPKDFVKPLIDHFAMQLIIDRVRVRPGYHLLVAKVENGGRNLPYLALPGNPQSAIAALTSLGLPIIDVLAGRRPKAPGGALLAVEVKTPEGFSRLIPGRVIAGEFVPAQHLGSAMLRGLADSEGFALVDPGNWPAGSTVRWIPLPFSPGTA